MWEAVAMNYVELRKLKAQLIGKPYKSADELRLLTELQSLSEIIDRDLVHSLAMPSKVCKACGKPL